MSSVSKFINVNNIENINNLENILENVFQEFIHFRYKRLMLLVFMFTEINA